jgi:hypothetical protein
VNVAWLGSAAGTSSRQVRLRQFFNGPSFLLSVGIIPGGSGQVTSAPIGIDCPATRAASSPDGHDREPHGNPRPRALFDKWTGACIGSAACNMMTAARSLNASFVPAAMLTIAKSGLGTITGTGIACGADCD